MYLVITIIKIKKMKRIILEICFVINLLFFFALFVPFANAKGVWIATVASVTAAVQGRLMLVYGAVPGLLMGLGALFLLGFPITRQRHAAVRAELEARS